MIKRNFRRTILTVLSILAVFYITSIANIATIEAAQPFPEININFGNTNPTEGEEITGGSVSLQILFLTVMVALLPSILMVMTTFTRIIIVFSFARSAMGTQQMPPNQVLVGLALMLTLFLMSPQISEIMENAVNPLSAGQISQTEAIDQTLEPLRRFMFRQVSTQNLSFFAGLSGQTFEPTPEAIPLPILVSAFILGELTAGFIIGVVIYVPFIVIDMVVASVLMAMGMMMLPPAMISLPFKVLLFVMVDGWRELIQALVSSFN
ncbi:MAG: flagellar type III secretion system pore protein FliP [Defluviitaleaceae bacterium]|nr:flagellar type III secretion system pore protein FliP [Defluviitaleaceae bacterium]